MNTWYGVITSFYDNGRMTAMLVDTIEADERPESSFKSLRRCDTYVDWFPTVDEANAFIAESKLA